MMHTRIRQIFLLPFSFLLPLITIIGAQEQGQFVVEGGVLEKKCLEKDPSMVTDISGGVKATLEVRNESPLALVIKWVGNDGNDSPHVIPGVIMPGESGTFHTKTRHIFRVYDEELGLLREHNVSQASDHIVIHEACHVVDKEAIQREMESLVHNQTEPCLPEDASPEWSCIRYIPRDEYQRRLDEFAGTVYGFSTKEESQTREIGDTEDKEWSFNIPKIPRVTTSGPGFLKMSFTKRMNEILLPWYKMHKKGGPRDMVRQHHVIRGGFTNSHTVTMSMLNIPHKLKLDLIQEMRRVLMWWTGGRPLEETATFGIRIYHRNSMLINHVDRADTHLASAVLQIAQEGVDQGWPLEVLHPDNSCSEVYLQPGEMVLYEGARFRHGRPMRLNGTDFANLFTHFRPYDWHGPGNSPRYDNQLDHDGFLKGSPSSSSTTKDEL